MTDSPTSNKLNLGEKFAYKDMLNELKKSGLNFEFEFYPENGLTVLTVEPFKDSITVFKSTAVCNLKEDIFNKKRGKLITLRRFLSNLYVVVPR